MKKQAYVGLPWKREVDALAADKVADWILAHVKDGIGIGKRTVVGNLVWVGRSLLIGDAKRLMEGGRDFHHVQFDSDAYPRSPDPARAYHIVQERFDSGAGIVVAPVHSLAREAETGQIMWVKEWNEHPSNEADPDGFRIQSGSFTWVFLNPEFLRKLEPEGLWKPTNGGGIPIYTWTDREHTEDVRLIKRAEAIGFSTWCDKRLMAGHGKMFEVPGYGIMADEV